MPDTSGRQAFWGCDAPALLRSLGSGPGGLSEADARATLKRFGANDVRDDALPLALRLAGYVLATEAMKWAFYCHPGDT